MHSRTRSASWATIFSQLVALNWTRLRGGGPMILLFGGDGQEAQKGGFQVEPLCDMLPPRRQVGSPDDSRGCCQLRLLTSAHRCRLWSSCAGVPTAPRKDH